MWRYFLPVTVLAISISAIKGCGGDGSGTTAVGSFDLACEGCELVFAERFDSKGEWSLQQDGKYAKALIRDGELHLDAGAREWRDAGYPDEECGIASASLDLDSRLDVRPDWVWKYRITHERAKAFDDDSPKIRMSAGSIASSFVPAKNYDSHLGSGNLISYRVVSGDSIVLAQGEEQEKKAAYQLDNHKPGRTASRPSIEISVHACEPVGREYSGDVAITLDYIEIYKPKNADDLSYVDELAPSGHNGSSQPGNFIVLGDTLLFTASDGSRGKELWKTDGTTSGTSLLRDINPGSAWSQPDPLFYVNEILFFSADDGVSRRALWKTDATAAGTVKVAGIQSVRPQSFASEDLKLINGEACFAAHEDFSGTELWKTDGTMSGTTMVRDIRPGPGSSYPDDFIFGDKLFFTADDGISGREVWVSDGTASGTTLVSDIRPGPDSSRPDDLFLFAGKLYFTADDGISGREIWISDGTQSGTMQFKEITPGIDGSKITFLATFNGELYFNALQDWMLAGRDWELWKTDGTESGTVMVKDTSGFRLTVMNGFLYFISYDDIFGEELWKTDGSPSGTTMVKDINPDGSSFPEHLTVLNDTLYFVAENDDPMRQIWKTDGTPGGTQMVADVGRSGSSGRKNLSTWKILTAYKNKIYFVADDRISGRELWKTNGTADGTRLVRDINNWGGSSIASHGEEVILFQSELYFSAYEGFTGTELWKTDGSRAGTVLVKDIDE